MVSALKAVTWFNMLKSEDPDNLHLSLWERLLYELDILATRIPMGAI